LRTIDQKRVAEEVDELRNKLKALDRIDEALDVRRREELRISRTMDGIETKINQATTASENEQRAVSGIKEAGEKNNLRINELENRGSSVSKRVDELRSLFDLQEDQLQKLSTRAQVVELGERELRQSQNLWMEQQAARLAEFERAWIAWEKRFAEFEIQSDDLMERIESYEETHRSLRLLRDELNDVVERLNRRIEEVSEIQRLSEDRFKQEWSTFQADIQKRWSSFKLSSDEQWKEHGRKHESISEQLKQLHARSDTALSSIEQLDRSSKGRISDLQALVQEWGAELRDGDS
jgi:chromosome segregation ATPase